ncbi:MAG: MFS transporter [Candidatus Dormibacteria bacterium]
MAFWTGSAAILGGVLLHLPDYVGAADRHYRMAGMPVSPTMVAGMALIVAGVALAAFGVIPTRSRGGTNIVHSHGHEQQIRALDQAVLTSAHHRLLGVLAIALVIDVMKPATLGFVIPGMRAEYGISASAMAVLPFVALSGTAFGSLLWGGLADRAGRRAAILLAALLFMGTSICGAMPAFGWNLVMCFLMGMSAGGLLPIVYALLAESVPSRSRGWVMVLEGGIGTAGGYLAASGLAALLVPAFGWRIMWLLGLPTGAALLVLNRFIPESPRFLIEQGEVQTAVRVMACYGVTLTPPATGGGQSPPGVPGASEAAGHRATFAGLFRAPYLMLTVTILLPGLAWGVVNWGFLTFLPTFLSGLGYRDETYRTLLAQSALLSLPAVALVAWLYGTWSSRRTMVLCATATTLTLLAFSFFRPGSGEGSRAWLTVLVVALLSTSGGVIAMLSPYAAEIYPTGVRGMAGGLAAGSSKVGGMLAAPMFAGIVALSGGLAATALLVAIPMAAAAVVLGRVGIETRGRPLEEILRNGNRA